MTYLSSGLKAQKKRAQQHSFSKTYQPELNNFGHNIWCAIITAEHPVCFLIVYK